MISDTAPSARIRSLRFLIYLAGLALALLLVRCEAAAHSTRSAPHDSHDVRQGAAPHVAGDPG